MSETIEEISAPYINEEGDYVDPKAKPRSRFGSWLEGKKAVVRWAIDNIRKGNHRRPVPGLAKRNLEAMSNKLDNAPQVTIGPSGEVMPKQSSTKDSQ